MEYRTRSLHQIFFVFDEKMIKFAFVLFAKSKNDIRKIRTCIVFVRQAFKLYIQEIGDFNASKFKNPKNLSSSFELLRL